MLKYKTGYTINSTENVGGKRRSLGRYFKKTEAKKELSKLLSKPKGNKTSYRNSLTGFGINNPRIKKMRFLR